MWCWQTARHHVLQKDHASMHARRHVMEGLSDAVTSCTVQWNSVTMCRETVQHHVVERDHTTTHGARGTAWCHILLIDTATRHRAKGQHDTTESCWMIDPTTPRRAEGLRNDIWYRGTTWCHVLPGISFRVRDRVRIQLFQYPGMADPWSGRPPEWRTQIPFQGYHFFKNKTPCIFITCHYNAAHLCF